MRTFAMSDGERHNRLICMLIIFTVVSIVPVDSAPRCPPGGTYRDKHTGRSECCSGICRNAKFRRTEESCNKFCPGKLASSVFEFFTIIFTVITSFYTWNMLILFVFGTFLFPLMQPPLYSSSSKIEFLAFGYLSKSWFFALCHAWWRHAHVDSTILDSELTYRGTK